MKKVLVIGSTNYDLVVQVDEIPLIGQTVIGSRIDYYFGGKGANQAVAASRLGADTTFVSCVGNDEYGRLCLDNLKSNGVNCQYVKTVDESTGLAIINVSPSDNNIVVVPGANSLVSIDDLGISKYDLVVLQNEINTLTTQEIILKCYQVGVEVLYNPAPYINIGEVMHKVKYLTPNETEFALLSQDYDIEELLASGVIIIMTCGKDGIKVIKSEEEYQVAALSVDVVDTTGAGDTFNGALAAFICQDGFNLDSIKKAVKCASISITKSGAQGGMPFKEDIDYD